MYWRVVTAIRQFLLWASTSSSMCGNRPVGQLRIPVLLTGEVDAHLTVSLLPQGFSMEPLASIHADLPRRVQQKLREFILHTLPGAE